MPKITPAGRTGHRLLSGPRPWVHPHHRFFGGGPVPPTKLPGDVLGCPPYFEDRGSEYPHGKSKNCPSRPNRPTPPFRATSVGAPTQPFLGGGPVPPTKLPGDVLGCPPPILRAADRKIHMRNPKNGPGRPNRPTPSFRAPSVGAPTQPFFRRGSCPLHEIARGVPTPYFEGGGSENAHGKSQKLQQPAKPGNADLSGPRPWVHPHSRFFRQGPIPRR